MPSKGRAEDNTRNITEIGDKNVAGKLESEHVCKEKEAGAVSDTIKCHTRPQKVAAAPLSPHGNGRPRLAKLDATIATLEIGKANTLKRLKGPPDRYAWAVNISETKVLR